VTPTRAWVVGAGGLLGSSVVRALPRHLQGVAAWTPAAKTFRWHDPAALQAELGSAARDYLASLEQGRPWMVFWCAGIGVVGTPAAALAQETRALEVLLGHLGAASGSRPGYFFLASSAGGVHAGGGTMPLTEETPPHPISDYGRAKQRQEELLAAWAAGRENVSTLAGRISNLYGPGQNLSKPQGLISHLSRCLLHHVPAHVFAPLDTLRDLLYAPDAAGRIVTCMDRLVRLPPPVRMTKIIASGRTATIGEILAVFSKVAKRRIQTVCSAHAAGSLQPSRLLLRSTVWTDLAMPALTPLEAGILSVYAHHLRLFQDGALPLPPANRT
jgi:UDP-glucose 4-epimerase